MSETAEGIGGRKWSLLRVREDAIALMEGKTEVALMTSPLGDQTKLLLVTAPQLWAAANELIKVADSINLQEHVGGKTNAALKQLADMVAKAVGKTDWKEVLQ